MAPGTARQASLEPLRWAASVLPHPQASRADTGFCIQPGKFHGVFAANLPAGEAAVLAASQQPAADIAFGEPLAVEPGWKKVPSWFIVARSDHAINRAPSAPPPSGWARPTVQIDGGSHAIALSQPDRACTAAIITERVLARLAPAPCCGHGQMGGALPRAHSPQPGGC